MPRVSKKIAERQEKRGFITIPAAAEKVGISDGTIYGWADAGEIDFEDLMGVRWIRRTSLAKKLGPLGASLGGRP